MARGVKYDLDLASSLTSKFKDSGSASKSLDLASTLTLLDPLRQKWSLGLTTATSKDPLYTFEGIINNILGGGESVRLSTYTTYPFTDQIKAGRLTIESPILGSFWTASLSGFWTSDVIGHSSHSRDVQGTAAYVSRMIMNQRVHTEFGIEASNRSVHSVKNSASDSVRVDAGESLKALAYAKLGYNSLNSFYGLPTRGSNAEFVARFSGLNQLGDVSYQSLEANGAIFKSLDPKKDRLVVALDGYAGWMNNAVKTTLSDRLYLSHQNIYGFESNGIGPKDCQDAIGGHAAVSAAASVYGKLPMLVDRDSPLRWKMAFNGGSLVSDADSKLLRDNISTGCGVGLSYRSEIACMEIMYAMPLASHSHDLVRQGLQFNVGLELY